MWTSLLPLPGLSRAGQNPSSPSVAVGQPHPSSCVVNVHAKTALTEPARTRELAAIGSRDTGGHGASRIAGRLASAAGGVVQRRFLSFGWGLLALAVVMVAVVVTVGALRARGADAFNRWVGWATVTAVPVAAVGVMLVLREKIAPGTASHGMSIREVEDELVAVVLAEAQVARSRLIGVDEAGDQAANVRFVKGRNRFREVGGASEGDLMSVLEYYQSLSPGRMVVLGEPGAGKTVLALELQVRLLEHRQRDITIPVPVLVSAASYNPELAWEDWLAGHLALRFAIDSAMASRLVRDGRILPLVDGVDEMDPGPGEMVRAGVLVATLNAWMRGREKAPVVVTCRRAEYRALKRGVDRATQVEMVPLTGVEAAAYLRTQFLDQDEEDRWKPVLAALDADPCGPLAVQLATPWRLTLALAAFQGGGDPAGLLPATSDMTDLVVSEYAQRVDTQLLGRYVPAAVALHDRAGRYTSRDVQRWLAAFADGLTRQGRYRGSPTDIRLDLWWQSAGLRAILLVQMALVTIPLALLALIFWATSANDLMTAGAVELALWAPIQVIISDRNPEPRQLRTMRIRAPHDLRTFATPIASGSLVGLLTGLYAWRVFNFADARLAFTGFFVGTFVMTLTDSSDNPLRAVGPRDVIREDGLASLVSGLGIAVAVGFAFTGLILLTNELRAGRNAHDPVLGLMSGLTLGPAFALIVTLTMTGCVWTRYRIAVAIFAIRQRGPWRFGAFLEWAQQAGLLRVSGVAYQFRHHQLQEWLTSYPTIATVAAPQQDEAVRAPLIGRILSRYSRRC